MNIDKALQTQGWMTELELEWLATQASRHLAIVEIGAWLGRSTRALADNTPGLVYTVDTWDILSPVNPLEDYRELSREPGWAYGIFRRNVSDLTNVRAFAMPSTQCAAVLRRHTFSMIFIDALHDYESVKADIDAWSPLLRPGGLLCGHDYSWPGVKQAVSERFRSVQTAGDIWFV